MAKATEPTLEFYQNQIDLLLHKAISDPMSRLNWVTLASVNTSKNGLEPDLRIVVLREIDQEKNLCFFTDSRSPKNQHFKENPRACALLFDQASMMQLRIYGEIQVDTDSEYCLKAVDKLSVHSLVNYATQEAPGTPSSSADILYDHQKTHFARLLFTTQKFDLLHLRREGSLRIQAMKGAHGKLNQLQWLTP